MSNAITIMWQIILMFILAMTGYGMYKGKKISDAGSKSLGNILIYLSLPCVIINSFLVERTPERVRGFLLSALMALVILFLAIVISRLLLRKNAIEAFAGAFSNPGFFGIPLITAYLSGDSVFYIAPFIAFLNLFQWTYGVDLLERSDKSGNLPEKSRGSGLEKGDRLIKRTAEMIRKMIRAPFMIAILVGCVLFFFRISLPSILTQAIGQIAGMNTPLAMFSVGIYLAQTDIVRMFTKRRLYYVAAVRMLIIPAAAVVVLLPIPEDLFQMKMAILIAAACPVGSNVAVYAQLHDKDYPYAVETVVISTCLSLITLPIVVGIGGMILR